MIKNPEEEADREHRDFRKQVLRDVPTFEAEALRNPNL